MATSTYYPYPMYVAQDSAPLQRRYDSMSTSSSTTPQYNGPTTPKRLHPSRRIPTKPAVQPKSVQRVDSGIDAASETCAAAFTEEVERVRAMKLHLRQYHDLEETCVDDKEEDEEDLLDEGNLGRRHRNSICMVTERASTWEDKAVRARRNRKSKFKLMKKWFKRKLVPGSDGRSWYLTL